MVDLRKVLGVVAVGLPLVLVGAPAARADMITVDFYTTGVFCATQVACATSTTTSIGNSADSVSISFAGVGSSSTPVEITNNPDSPLFSGPISLGTFTVDRGANGAQFNLGGYFDLTIFQSIPSIGNGSLLAQLTGQIKTDGTIDFTSDPSATIGIVSYLLNDSTINLADPNRNSTTQAGISANITHTDSTEVGGVVPEPATLFLLGTGLTGLMTRRRLRRA